MDRNLRQELRLLAVVTTILLAFGAVVTAVATAYGQLSLLRMPGFGPALQAIWASAFAFVLIVYSIDLLFRHRPQSPVRQMLADIGEGLLQPRWLVARTTVITVLVIMVFFTPAKILIGHNRPFAFDALLMHADRALFLGADPWRITHALFGGAYATFALQLVYHIWFGLMWLSIIYMLMRPELVAVRARFCIAFPCAGR